MSDFVFVQEGSPRNGLSREARRLVRSHTMQQNWTNTRTRHRRQVEHFVGEAVIDVGPLYGVEGGDTSSRSAGFNQDESLTSSSHGQNTDSSGLELLIPKLPVIHYLSSLLLFRFPVEVDDSMLSALHHFIYIFANAIYPHNSPVIVDPVKTLWLPLAIADTASFYAALSIATSHQGSLLGLKSSPRALSWKSEALQLINERLAISPEVSDGTLTAVLFMGSFDHFFGRSEDCDVHVSGSSQMIELRGGIYAIKDNSQLYRFAMWLDAAHACSLMQRPKYVDQHMEGLPDERTEKIMLANVNPGLEPLYMAKFSDRFQKEYHDARDLALSITANFSDALEVNSYTIVTMASQLLHREVASNYLSHPLIEPSCELGIIAFLSHLMFRYQKHPMISNPLLNMLKEFITTMRSSWDVCDPLYLWTLFMAGSACPASELQPWFVSKTLEVIKGGQYGDWEGIKKILGQILWVEELCQLPCRDFHVRIDVLEGLLAKDKY